MRKNKEVYKARMMANLHAVRSTGSSGGLKGSKIER